MTQVLVQVENGRVYFMDHNSALAISRAPSVVESHESGSTTFEGGHRFATATRPWVTTGGSLITTAGTPLDHWAVTSAPATAEVWTW